MSHLNGFFLEAFYTGSHRYFADSLCKVLPFDMKLITLPGRHWKWRMHEAAITFSKRLESLPKPDFVITSDMTDLATLKGLTPKLN
jgi:hypothetical protein